MQERETTSTAAKGDYVVEAATSAGDPVRWTIKGDKFQKFYEQTPEKTREDGFALHRVIPEERNVVVVGRREMDMMCRAFYVGGMPDQKEFLRWMKEAIDGGFIVTTKASKHDHVWARPASEGEQVTTYVKAGNEIKFNFTAPWGDTMPVAVGDVLVIMEDEVYRIASAEFGKTYKIL